jgi:hypothetical protein
MGYSDRSEELLKNAESSLMAATRALTDIRPADCIANPRDVLAELERMDEFASTFLTPALREFSATVQRLRDFCDSVAASKR